MKFIGALVFWCVVAAIIIMFLAAGCGGTSATPPKPATVIKTDHKEVDTCQHALRRLFEAGLLEQRALALTIDLKYTDATALVNKATALVNANTNDYADCMNS